MSASRFQITAIAVLVAAITPTVTSAQDVDCGPFCDNYNMQWFEPVDLDLNCHPIGKDCGFFLRYDKLYWNISGERTTIGAPGAVVNSEQVFIDLTQNPILPGNQPAVPAYDIVNGIQDAVPDADFGWGERYELGYTDDKGRSFTVGILDGPTVNSNETYGFPPDPITGTTPFGFGSVHVNWVAPTRFFEGWRDYGFAFDDIDLDDLTFTDSGVSETVDGPGDVFIGLPDGIIDDLNFNLDTFFLVDSNGDGIIDAIVVDYDDLHEFNFRYNQLDVRNVTETQGVELMYSHRLDNRHYMAKRQNNRFEFGYGMRFMRIRDNFSFDGVSDVFGRTFANTQSDNQLIGPQIRLMWKQQHAKWSVDTDGRFMLAYNIQDNSLRGGFGELAAPGALNRSLIAQPTYSAYGRQDNDLSPLVEIRANVRYQLSTALALRAGFTGIFVDNVTRASQLVEYRAPEYGLNPGGKQAIFMSGLNFGIEGKY